MLRLVDLCPCPRKGEDPYSMENIPENLGFELKMKDGIVNVYDNMEALRDNQPRNLPYPDLETFAIDLSHVLAMIADGPTWVTLTKCTLASLLGDWLALCWV